MKWALLSDIHANLRALDACLAHAQGQGADAFALLGDLVGYGAEPAAVVDRAMALAGQGAVVIKGNHDELAVSPGSSAKTVGELTAIWTHHQLSAAQRSFLQALPLQHRAGEALLVHANADGPARWRYVTTTQVAQASLDAVDAKTIRYVFVGHVHEQTVFYRGSTGALMQFRPSAGVAMPAARHRQWLITVGSVGQPRDGNPASMYAMWDSDARQVMFHRIPYDHLGAARAVRAAGLGDELARRLEEGR